MCVGGRKWEEKELETWAEALVSGEDDEILS